MKVDLDSKFRVHDPNNTGIIKKPDFINVIFENVRSIQASELMQFMNLFTTSFDDVVNYDDFLKVLYKFGDMPFQQPPHYLSAPGQDYSPLQQHMQSLNLNQEPMISSKQQQDLATSGANVEVMQKLRETLVQRLKPQQREVVGRLRAQLQGQGLEEILRKLARDNKDQISEDDLLIGISRLNANIHIGDIKELTNIIRDGKEGAKISIAETVQLIGH